MRNFGRLNFLKNMDFIPHELQGRLKTGWELAKCWPNFVWISVRQLWECMRLLWEEFIVIFSWLHGENIVEDRGVLSSKLSLGKISVLWFDFLLYLLGVIGDHVYFLQLIYRRIQYLALVHFLIGLNLLIYICLYNFYIRSKNVVRYHYGSYIKQL